MRVLHISQPVDGGVAACVAALAEGQSQKGLDVVVAAPTDGWLADRCRTSGLKFAAWDSRRSPVRGLAREFLRLRSIVAEVNPDVVHLHSSKAGLVGRIVVRGRRPTVFQPHGWSFLAMTGLGRAAAVRWEARAVRWTGSVVCVSQDEVETGAAAGLAAGSLTAIPNGVDVERMPWSAPPRREAARATLGIGDEVRMVVCVGRLCEQKGQDRLLRAWPTVLEQVPDAQLYLVGDGPSRTELQEVAPAGVTFVGQSADVVSWMSAADVLTMPSRWEGMALAVLEACAAARSVVATDVAGMSEVLGVDPAPGGPLLRNDSRQLLGDLAAALVRRLRDDRLTDAEGSANRQRVIDKFSAASTLTQTVDVYARVIEDPSPPVPGSVSTNG